MTITTRCTDESPDDQSPGSRRYGLKAWLLALALLLGVLASPFLYFVIAVSIHGMGC